MDVYWLEQTSADLPAGDDWLSVNEAIRQHGMRFPKRRADWRLGRWTAKRLVAVHLSLPADPRSLARIEIRAAPGGAPEVVLGSEPAPVVISISHRGGRAVCAIAGPQAALGCDLEIAEPRSQAFATDYFTAAEQELLAQASLADRWQLLALLWSGKESVLKALRVGLRLDTRCVAIDPFLGQVSDGSDWRPLCAHHDGQVLSGWWRQTGGPVRTMVRTMVAVPAPAAPRAFGRDRL
ncbi:MAG TPA: 4'-phosphopantetheinyl transferase superfamily protein [Bryobacteraceae bacterium]|jgi:4'-phosphopantetheinyl transferase|nr:4'-phosphopantetheinyl transferase superfamily protein [Bryobacteraceae bacterium]